MLQAEGPFQTIMCPDVLEHIFDPWKIVARAAQVPVPGGVIVASVPNARHYTPSFSWPFRIAAIYPITDNAPGAITIKIARALRPSGL